MSTISTSCTCSFDSSVEALKNAGISSDVVASVLAQVNVISPSSGWVNSISTDGSSLSISTVLVGYGICGGVNASNAPLSVCKTKVSNHTNGQFQVTYKTDGTPTSIAAKITTLISTGLPADISFLYRSLYTMLGGAVSSTLLPSHWPGIVIK